MNKECFVVYYIDTRSQKVYMDNASGNSVIFTSTYNLDIRHYDTERKAKIAVSRLNRYFLMVEKKIFIKIDKKIVQPIWEWRPPSFLQYEKVVVSSIAFKKSARRCMLFFKVGKLTSQYCSVCGMSLYGIPYLGLHTICCFCLKKAYKQCDELLTSVSSKFIEEVKQERIIHEIDPR